MGERGVRKVQVSDKAIQSVSSRNGIPLLNNRFSRPRSPSRERPKRESRKVKQVVVPLGQKVSYREENLPQPELTPLSRLKKFKAIRNKNLRKDKIPRSAKKLMMNSEAKVDTSPIKDEDSDIAVMKAKVVLKMMSTDEKTKSHQNGDSEKAEAIVNGEKLENGTGKEDEADDQRQRRSPRRLALQAEKKVEEATSRGEEMASRREEMASKGEEVASKGEEVASKGEEVASKEEEANKAETKQVEEEKVGEEIPVHRRSPRKTDGKKAKSLEEEEEDIDVEQLDEDELSDDTSVKEEYKVLKLKKGPPPSPLVKPKETYILPSPAIEIEQDEGYPRSYMTRRITGRRAMKASAVLRTPIRKRKADEETVGLFSEKRRRDLESPSGGSVHSPGWRFFSSTPFSKLWSQAELDRSDSMVVNYDERTLQDLDIDINIDSGENSERQTGRWRCLLM